MSEAMPLTIPEPFDSPSKLGLKSCTGGVCAARGVKAAGISAGFRKNPERLDFAVVAVDEPCPCAATFTQNRFCAAPVQISRERVASGHARAVMLNSGNANAATGSEGLEVARASSALLAKELNADEDDILVASTGVIGQQLPLKHFESGVPAIVAALEHSAQAAHNAATAVMTTDTKVKESAYEFELPAKDGGKTTVHVGGLVKGSGMICPNMATMLAVVTTDAPLDAQAAHQALLDAVRCTFNHVTVDSDTSTNDSCFLLATGQSGAAPIQQGSDAYALVAGAIRSVCADLARKIAADGEGSTRLITVDVLGADTQHDADTVAFAIANSPLVKCAIYGHDANWGRVAAAAGKCGVAFDQYQVDIDFMGVPVLRQGLPLPMDEEKMLRLFESPEISIAICLGKGQAHARVWTCDLTHDYVKINGEYRT